MGSRSTRTQKTRRARSTLGTSLAAADDLRMAALLSTIAIVERSVRNLPPSSREHAGNALLNVALGYLCEQYGRLGAAGLLARVADALAGDSLPNCPDRAFDPLRTDA
jgi:hypothetical protein